MKAHWLVLFLSVLLIASIWLAVSCGGSSGGGDDDDNAGGGDDDAGDDADGGDDDASGDDDSSGGDDDVGDDDCGGDDDSMTDDDTATGDTWTDSSSGLTWQVTPLSDHMTWDEAKTYCQTLTLAGGGWHLPTISELRSLIRGCDATVTGGACGVTDDCIDSSCRNDPCVGCDYLAGPGSGGAYWPDGMSGVISWYWSSSVVADVDSYVWRVVFNSGLVSGHYIDDNGFARCVR